MNAAFEKFQVSFGPIHILVTSAGYLSTYSLLSNADSEEWWRGFDVNVKSLFNSTRALLSVSSKDPVLINVSSCGGHLLPSPGLSAYSASELAGAKVVEYFGKE
jgi:NADP-dependent 3-hydroxy acid dehydrogenase YdfG